MFFSKMYSLEKFISLRNILLNVILQTNAKLLNVYNSAISRSNFREFTFNLTKNLGHLKKHILVIPLWGSFASI